MAGRLSGRPGKTYFKSKSSFHFISPKHTLPDSLLNAAKADELTFGYATCKATSI